MGDSKAEKRLTMSVIVRRLGVTKPVDKAGTQVFAGFSKTEMKNHHGFLHAFREKPVTRRKLLALLASLDIGVVVVKLDKQRVFTDMADGPHLLYNSIVNILMNRIVTRPHVAEGEPLRLVASQRETKGLLNEGFVAYLSEHIKTPPGVSLTVEVRHPTAEKGLQAVDLLSWSLFRQYEHGDASYADLIGERLLEVNNVFG
jgi:hypothetical protein